MLNSKPLPTVDSFYRACIINSYLSFHPSYNALYYSLVRKAHLAGLLPFLYLIMAILYIKEPFMMPFVFVMAGSPLPCLQVVFVGNQ